eukprot:Lithocolla_globosa_v1_NODE_2591_length_1942_cov_4.568098.p2 type:complete len:106 gc:universal NODE_2591_length_1942_cov_4.568098:536-219(-)
MPKCHLINDGRNIRCSLVIHAPTTIDELQLSIFHQLLDNFFFRRCLFFPPSCEKSHLHFNELPIWIIDQSMNHRIQNVLDLIDVVFINCSKPARVIMAVWHQPDV